jgi:3-oxoacyl-[acyl-carrier protein] reductase
MPLPLDGKTSLVTGASRGIGAQVARKLASLGSAVVLNFRSKSARAELVAEEIEGLGQTAMTFQADLTIPAELKSMMDAIAGRFGRLDILILNASGGLEQGKGEDYAMALNATAQLETARLASELMSRGGRIVFVTSHWAHFYGQKPVMEEYELVARSKNAGEQALREYASELEVSGISFAVVSGDAIEGTITPRLLERKSRSRGETGVAQSVARKLPTIEEFAEAIVQVAADADAAGSETIFVGSTEY